MKIFFLITSFLIINLTNLFSQITLIDSTSGSRASGSPLTISHNVSSGDDKILIVKISTVNAVSSVTWDGNTMTQLSTINNSGARSYIYYYLNPEEKTGDVIITKSSGAGDGCPTIGEVETWEDVNQGTPFGTPVTNYGTSTSASVSVSSDIGEKVIDVVTNKVSPTFQSSTLTVGANQTQNFNRNRSGCVKTYGAGSYEEGASSVTMSWTLSTSRNWSIIGVSLKNSGSALPVTLIKFEGEVMGDDIYLSWITATEMNSHYFEIERSVDLIKFEKIGKIPASGYSSYKQYYFFIDKNPDPNIYYYRLKEIDFDGQFMYSWIIPIRIGVSENVMTYLYLTHDQYKAWFKSLNTNILVYDIKGSEVFCCNSNLFDIDLLSGYYFILMGQTMIKVAIQ